MVKPGRFLALHGDCSECSQLIQHAQCSLLRNLQLIWKHQFVFLMIDEMKLVLTWNNNDRLLFIKKDQIFKQLIINSKQRFVFNHPCIELDNKYILIINYVLVKKYWMTHCSRSKQRVSNLLADTEWRKVTYIFY